MSNHEIHERTRKGETEGLCLLLLVCFVSFVVPAFGDTHYVSTNGLHQTPFTNWVTAASNIQAAINVCSTGDTVLVSNGVYRKGGVAGYPKGSSLTNRVAIHRAVTVLSVNGPAVTVIEGQRSTSSPVRCVYMTNGAYLSGFTLTNGCGFKNEGHTNWGGGGAWGEGLSAVVSNCALRNNSASYGSYSADGGGAYRVTLFNCLVTGNSATTGVEWSHGGGVSGCLAYNSLLSGNKASGFGGGADGSSLYNCTIRSNSASQCGGARGGSPSTTILRNCLIANNVANNSGGAASCRLSYCTVAGNSANYDAGVRHSVWVDHSIIYANTPDNWQLCPDEIDYSCTSPTTDWGVGNITNDPLFVSVSNKDYRVRELSPCIDIGHVAEWMDAAATDLDGRPRVVNATPDLGCYETPYHLALKVLLQGPYQTNLHLMTTDLATVLPSTAPYAMDRRSAAVIPSNTADWVLLQLKSSGGEDAKDSRSVFLRNDGSVVSDEGTNIVSVDISRGDYYVVVQHRNHLAAMSAQPIAFTNIFTAYDFTDGSTRYAGGTNAAVELEPGVWGMIAGDADGDGEVTPTDREIVEEQAGKTGYLSADLNLDGAVTGDE